MKKILLTLRAFAAVAAPVATIVSCGDKTSEPHKWNGAINVNAQRSYYAPKDFLVKKDSKIHKGDIVNQAEIGMGASVNSWHLSKNESLVMTLHEDWDTIGKELKLDVQMKYKIN